MTVAIPQYDLFKVWIVSILLQHNKVHIKLFGTLYKSLQISVGGDGSEAGSKTESLTTKSEAYSGSDSSKTSLTTSPYPSTISALIKEKNCTEKDPEIMPGPVPSKGDSECR